MSNTEGISSCCLSGHLHEGTPKGKYGPLGNTGLDAYVTGDESNKSKTVLFIPDIFGVKLPNAQLLADEYAEQGKFYVIAPDVAKDDWIDHALLKSIAPQKSDPEPGMVEKAAGTAKVGAALGPWLVRHREGVTLPLVQKVLEHVRADSATGKIGAVGFCWGGRYAILLGQGDKPIDAVVANHPSFATDDEIANVTVPTQINVGDADAMMSVDQAKKAKEALGGKSFKAEVNIIPDAVHGFAVRGDQNNDKEKKDKDTAAENTIKFLSANL